MPTPVTPPLVICASCPHSQRPCGGPGQCACTIDGRQVTDHAAKADCPKGFHAGVPLPAPTAPDPHPEPWPFICRQIRRFHQPGHTGIGDTLEAAFAVMGAEAVKAAMTAAGIECGCEARRAWLNARFPY